MPETDQDVLRADVAVDEGAPGRRGGPDQRIEALLQIAMHPPRRYEIGLEADGVEAFIRGEPARDIRLISGGRMNTDQALGDGLRDAFLNDPVPQLVLPGRILLGI